MKPTGHIIRKVIMEEGIPLSSALFEKPKK